MKNYILAAIPLITVCNAHATPEPLGFKGLYLGVATIVQAKAKIPELKCTPGMKEIEEINCRVPGLDQSRMTYAEVTLKGLNLDFYKGTLGSVTILTDKWSANRLKEGLVAKYGRPHNTYKNLDQGFVTINGEEKLVRTTTLRWLQSNPVRAELTFHDHDTVKADTSSIFLIR